VDQSASQFYFIYFFSEIYTSYTGAAVMLPRDIDDISNYLVGWYPTFYIWIVWEERVHGTRNDLIYWFLLFSFMLLNISKSHSIGFFFLQGVLMVKLESSFRTFNGRATTCVTIAEFVWHKCKWVWWRVPLVE
jgi:hypothetical protein